MHAGTGHAVDRIAFESGRFETIAEAARANKSGVLQAMVIFGIDFP